MIALALAGCDADSTLLEERSRPLGDVTVGAVTWSFVADQRRWRTSAGWTDDGPTLGGDRTVVSFRATTPSGRLRGHPDHTWTFGDGSAGDAAYDGLALESCATADRAAYRVGDGWRWLAPVGPGGVAALIERDVATCEEALAAWPSAEAWLRGALSHPDACAHLTHLRRREDAVRCLLRQSADAAPDFARRDHLPNAPNDPGFDDDLLAVLSVSTGDPTFAPYRVRGLLPELGPEQRTALGAALKARGRPLLPWEVVALAIVEPEAALALPLTPGTVEAALAADALALAADHPWRRPAETWPPAWSPAWLPAPIPCSPTVRPGPATCP